MNYATSNADLQRLGLRPAKNSIAICQGDQVVTITLDQLHQFTSDISLAASMREDMRGPLDDDRRKNRIAGCGFGMTCRMIRNGERLLAYPGNPLRWSRRCICIFWSMRHEMSRAVT